MKFLLIIGTLLGSPAMASGLHAGIPVAGVPGLGVASFQSPEVGWMAPIEGGFVRVFVGQTEDEAHDWAARMGQALSLGAPPAVDGFGDEAWGDTTGLLIVREGNVAFQIRHDGHAADLARLLLSSIEDAPLAWPSSPHADWVHVQFIGGQARVGWDHFGRALRLPR
jgi:hypothetical protein